MLKIFTFIFIYSSFLGCIQVSDYFSVTSGNDVLSGPVDKFLCDSTNFFWNKLGFNRVNFHGLDRTFELEFRVRGLLNEEEVF